MGTKGLAVASLLATFLLLIVPVPPLTEAGLIQVPPELTEYQDCNGQPCLIPMLRPKRDDDPAPAADPPADGAPAAAPADGAPAPAGDAAATAGGAPAAPGGGGAAAPAAGLGEIPLPPVTQQMPNLPPNFPYPDVKVVQEVPVPTKPRKKLIIGGGGGGVNPNPFPPIGPIDPEPPMEAPVAPMETPSEKPEPPLVAPIERESVPLIPSKPDCNAAGGYGPPQDWRFPKARGHKKCPPALPPPQPPSNSIAGVGDEDDDDVSVNLRTVQRDDEAGATHTTEHPHGKGSAVSTVCSMGALLVAVVASFVNFPILN